MGTVNHMILFSKPLVLTDDHLRVIRSALVKTRKTSGSRLTEELIEEISKRLERPESDTFDGLPFE